MEKHWKEVEINFGTIRENTSKTIIFTALNTIPEIVDISAQCGCTKPSYDKENKLMSVKFNAGYIPKHLTTTQPVRKMITVTYKDGSQEILFITGTKVK